MKEEKLNESGPEDSKTPENNEVSRPSSWNDERVKKRIRDVLRFGTSTIKGRAGPASQINGTATDVHQLTIFRNRVQAGLFDVPVTAPHRECAWLHNLYLNNLNRNPHWKIDMFQGTQYASFGINNPQRAVWSPELPDISIVDYMRKIGISAPVNQRSIKESVIQFSMPAEAKVREVQFGETSFIVCASCFNSTFSKIEEQVSQSLALLEMDSSTFFGAPESRLGALFRTETFFQMDRQSQTSLVLSHCQQLRSFDEVPPAIGLFIQPKHLDRLPVKDYSRRARTFDPITQDVLNKRTSAFLLGVVDKLGREVAAEFAGREQWYSATAEYRYWQVDLGSGKKSVAKSKVTLDKQTIQDMFKAKVTFDKEDASYFRVSATADELHKAFTTQTLTHIANVRTVYGGPTVAKAVQLGRLLKKMDEDFVDPVSILSSAPDIVGSIDSFFGIENDTRVYRHVEYCTDCNSVVNNVFYYIHDDSDSWVSTGWPLAMHDENTGEKFADFVYLAELGYNRRSTISEPPASAQFLSFDHLSATYQMRSILADIEDLVSEALDLRFRFPASLEGKVVGPIRRLSSAAQAKLYTTDVIRWVTDELPEGVDLDQTVSNIMKKRITSWVLVAIRKQRRKTVSHTPSSTETTEPDIVFTQHRYLLSRVDHDARKRVRYYGYESEAADVIFTSMHEGWIERVRSSHPDVAVIRMTNGSPQVSAAQTIDILRSHINTAFPQLKHVTFTLQSLLGDEATIKYNGTDGQKVTFMKPHFQGSVWTNATVGVRKFMVKPKDMDLYTIGERDRFEMLREATVEETKVLYSRHDLDVAVTEKTSNAVELMRCFGTLSDSANVEGGIMVGLANIVLMPVPLQLIAAAFTGKISQMCIDAVLEGRDSINVNLTVVASARLLRSKYKVDHRFIRTAPEVYEAISSDKLGEVPESLKALDEEE